VSKPSPLLVVVSGPSGVGKDSLLQRLKERGVDAHFAVTATTRPRRDHDDPLLTFLSEDEFDRLLANDGLLEHAQVYGYRYGVPKAPIVAALRQGKDVIVRVDVQGAASIRKLAAGALLVFLTAPSEELEARLRGRGKDDDASIKKRLAIAAAELERQPEFDHVIVNERDQLDKAADRLLAIMSAERSRLGRQPIEL
jgi:guanylate kinase